MPPAQVIGLRGDFGDAWTYDVYAQHSAVDASNGNLNYLSNANIINSLKVVPNPAGGAPVCVSVLNGTDPACVTVEYLGARRGERRRRSSTCRSRCWSTPP